MILQVGGNVIVIILILESESQVLQHSGPAAAHWVPRCDERHVFLGRFYGIPFFMGEVKLHANIYIYIYIYIYMYGCFPKIVGFPPNHPFFHRVFFPLFSPSILGETPLFLETPKMVVLRHFPYEEIAGLFWGENGTMMDNDPA